MYCKRMKDCTEKIACIEFYKYMICTIKTKTIWQFQVIHVSSLFLA